MVGNARVDKHLGDNGGRSRVVANARRTVLKTAVIVAGEEKRDTKGKQEGIVTGRTC